MPESCPKLLLSSTIYSHGEGPDSQQRELRQQPQHLPPSLPVAAGGCPAPTTGCCQLAAPGEWCVTAAVASPSLPALVTRAQGTSLWRWVWLVCGALCSCAGSLPLPAVPLGSQGLPGCSLFLQAVGFCCSCATVAGLGVEQPQDISQSHCDKRKAGESQTLISPSGSRAVTCPSFLAMWASLPSLGCHSSL